MKNSGIEIAESVDDRDRLVEPGLAVERGEQPEQDRERHRDHRGDAARNRVLPSRRCRSASAIGRRLASEVPRSPCERAAEPVGVAHVGRPVEAELARAAPPPPRAWRSGRGSPGRRRPAGARSPTKISDREPSSVSDARAPGAGAISRDQARTSAAPAASGEPELLGARSPVSTGAVDEAARGCRARRTG